MVRLGLLTALALSFTPGLLAETDQLPQCLSIEEGWQEALNVSARINSAETQIDQADYELRSIKARQRPQVSAFVRSGFGDGALQSAQLDNQLGLQFSYQLFDFGRTDLQIEGAGYAKDARAFNARAIRRQVLSSFLETLVEIQHSERLQTIYGNRIETLRARLESADRQLANKTMTVMDHSRLSSEAAMMELQLSATEGREQRSRLSLAQLLQNDQLCIAGGPALDIYITGNRTPDLEAFLNAIEFEPRLQGIEKEVEAARSKYRSARREWMPSLSASGFVSQTYNDFTDRFDGRDRVGFEVAAPIYDGGIKSNEANRQRARVKQLEFQLEQTKREIQTERSIAWTNYEMLEKATRASQVALDSALAHVVAIQRRMELGAGTVDELLQAEERLLNLEIQNLNLLSDRSTVLISLIDEELLDLADE